MLIQYVRDENRRPFGVVVALNKHQIGWSECNPIDQFDRELGKKIAIGRAKQGCLDRPYNEETLAIIGRMFISSSRYFKNDNNRNS